MVIDLWQPLAGLGLFLFSMRLIEDAIESASGSAFRNFIRRSTDNPIKGIACGTLATSVLQSSSLVGLMTLALVGAGVMRLRNALGIIFGANLGTTATGWIVALLGFKLDLDAAALPLIGLGGILSVAGSTSRFRSYARFVLGIGLLLMGLSFMKTASGDIAELINPETLAGLSGVQFLLFGVVFSAIIQSSSATMMITLAALNGGIIDLPAAAALAIGADLGTTVTLLIGAFKGNSAKKRVAAGHFFFNLTTDTLAFVFRLPLLAIVGWFTLSDLLSLVAFHSLFNLFGILLFLPLLPRFALLLEGLFVEQTQTVSRHLSPDSLKVTEAAIEAVELETGRLLKRVMEQNLLSFQPALPVPAAAQPIDRLPPEEILSERDRTFLDAYERSKRLEGEVLTYTADLQAMPLIPEQSAAIDQCQTAVRNAIHASKNLKDIQADLSQLANSSEQELNHYFERFRRAEADFYGTLLTIKRSPDHIINVEDFISASAQIASLHDELHKTIYTGIQNDLIGERQVSVLLNINRELMNSNQALLSALAGYLLSPAELESLNLVDQSA